jgi:hypothetical protein
MVSLLEFARSTVQRLGSLVPGHYLNRIVDAPAVLEFVDQPTVEILAAFDKFTAVLADAPSRGV